MALRGFCISGWDANPDVDLKIKIFFVNKMGF